MVSLYNNLYFSNYEPIRIIFSPEDLYYPIPHDFNYYSSTVVWNITLFNQQTNEFINTNISEPITNDYFIDTTYSGQHLIICKDAETAPIYNNLIFSGMVPKELC